MTLVIKEEHGWKRKMYFALCCNMKYLQQAHDYWDDNTVFCLVKHQVKFVSCVYAMENTCRVTHKISRL